jgi:hypothetical protein
LITGLKPHHTEGLNLIMATIRINDDDKKKLDWLCQEAQLSQPEAFHLALAAWEKQRLSKRLKLDYEALALDAEAMQAYKADSQILDRTSADGLIE